MKKPIYLDHHTSTRPHPLAVEQMVSCFRAHWAVADAPHQKGQEVARLLEFSTEVVRDHLGLKEEDRFFFTHSGAEAIQAVFQSHYLESIRESGRNHCLTTAIEASTILGAVKRLEKFGCKEKILSVNGRGQITKDVLAAALGPKVSLFSLSWANGLTGVIHPIADLAEVCRQQDVSIHVDVSEVLGKLYFRFDDFPIDYVTFEGRLIHAPEGTGGVLVKSGNRFSPLLTGHSPIPVSGIAALAATFQENERYFDQVNLETARLRDHFEKSICANLPDAVVFFQEAERLPNCCAIGFPGVHQEALLYFLNQKGVFATIGGGELQTLAHVLIASGVDPLLAQCAVSFSLSFDTTESEVDAAVAMICESVDLIQRCSEVLQ